MNGSHARGQVLVDGQDRVRTGWALRCYLTGAGAILIASSVVLTCYEVGHFHHHPLHDKTLQAAVTFGPALALSVLAVILLAMAHLVAATAAVHTELRLRMLAFETHTLAKDRPTAPPLRTAAEPAIDAGEASGGYGE